MLKAKLHRAKATGAAGLVQKGDNVIIVACCQMPAEEARKPTVVVLGEGNEIATRK